jgi:hypothetical protein
MSSKYVILSDGTVAEFAPTKSLTEIDSILSKDNLNRDTKYPTFSDPKKLPSPISSASSSVTATFVGNPALANLPATKQIELRTEEAKKQLEAQRELPKAIETAKITVDTVDKLLKHPGFEYLVGFGVPFATSRLYAGTPVAGANALLEQIKSRTFLEAFQMLKGAGAITEKEGTKAALNRMNANLSEKDFKEAAFDFTSSIQAAIDRASKSAGKPSVNIKPSLPPGVTVTPVTKP